MDKPDVDFIEGLSPAVSIDQKSTSRNPRSTVGTITEVYDYLRLLYARAGRPHCPARGRPIARPPPSPHAPPLPAAPRPQRPTPPPTDAPAGRRPGARARRGGALPGARTRHPWPQGRVRRPVSPAAGSGVLTGEGRRRGPHAD